MASGRKGVVLGLLFFIGLIAVSLYIVVFIAILLSGILMGLGLNQERAGEISAAMVVFGIPGLVFALLGRRHRRTTPPG